MVKNMINNSIIAIYEHIIDNIKKEIDIINKCLIIIINEDRKEFYKDEIIRLEKLINYYEINLKIIKDNEERRKVR